MRKKKNGQSLMDKAYGYVSERLGSGEPKPVQKLSEPSLAAACGVSRNPRKESVVNMRDVLAIVRQIDAFEVAWRLVARHRELQARGVLLNAVRGGIGLFRAALIPATPEQCGLCGCWQLAVVYRDCVELGPKQMKCPWCGSAVARFFG